MLHSTVISSTGSLYQKLCEVNEQWKKQSDFHHILNNLPASNDEYAMIQQHLSLVEEILRTRDVSHLTSKQQQERLANLDRLHAYWVSGAFPVNNCYDYRTPIFIDLNDNFCAVGHLIKASGHELLSRAISDQFNLSYLEAMSGEQLESWVKQSGLSFEELAWIQPGYPPSRDIGPFGGGTNGTVHAIISDEVTDQIYIGGEFSATNSVTGFNNVAMASSVSGKPAWNTMGTGINGPVYALLLHNGELYVGGDFSEAGGINANNVAHWDGTSWVPMPGLTGGVVNSLAMHEGVLYAAGSFSDTTLGNYSNIAMLQGNQWVSVGASTNGPIYALISGDSGLYLGGAFTQAGTANANHIAILNNGSFDSLENGVSDTVYALEWHNDLLYAGGGVGDSSSVFGLARYSESNDTWEFPVADYLQLNYKRMKNVKIYDLLSMPNRVEIAGSLPPLGTLYNLFDGRNLGTFYDTDTALFSDVAYLNGPSWALASIGEEMIIGGDFDISYVLQVGYPLPVAHLAITNFGPFTSVEEQVANQLRVKIYPNPTRGVVNISSKPGIVESVLIIDMLEKIYKQQFIGEAGESTISLEQVPPGTYFVELNLKNGEKVYRKLVVN